MVLPQSLISSHAQAATKLQGEGDECEKHLGMENGTLESRCSCRLFTAQNHTIAKRATGISQMSQLRSHLNYDEWLS